MVSQFRSLVTIGWILIGALVFVEPAFAQGWERTFGDNREDYGEAVIATADWGALVVGYSESYSADRDPDVYAIRLDVDGNVLWSRVYDEAYDERASSVIETTDGGFLIAGEIVVNPGDKANAYLLKIDADGNLEWSRQYGSPDLVETIKGIAPAADDGFVLVGAVAASGTAPNDVLLLKVADDGREIWRRSYGGNLSDEGAAISPFQGGYVLTGSTDNPDGSVGKNILLYRLQADGDTIWTRSIGGPTNEEAEGLLVTQDGQIVIAGQMTTDSLRAYIAKYDAEGEEVWSRQLISGLESLFRDVVELPNGHLVAAGLSSLDELNIDFLIAELDADGELMWLNTQGAEETYEAAEGLAVTPDGSLLLAGYNGQLSGLFNDVIVLKTDARGNAYTNTISGKIFFDRDGLCDEDVNDDPIDGWLVRVQGNGQVFFGTTDEQGNYEVNVNPGAYTVNVLLPTNLWKTCTPNGFQIRFDNEYDNARFDFPVSVAKECPYLEVNVSALTPQICEQTDYALEYRNVGTTSARNVRLEVTLDESLTIDEATAAYEIIGGKVVFRLGNLSAFQQGKIRLTVSNCDAGELLPQEAVRVKAEIFSDFFCANAGPNWDGSSVEVTGACEQDSIFFDISNNGAGDMSERRTYGVVEDFVMIRQDSFQLRAGQTMRVFWQKITGSTYRIIAEQTKDHPGSLFPTFALEGCVTEDVETFTTGFVTMFPENDQDPNISIDVQEARVGPAPEVELLGHPKGYDQDQLISNTTDLTYKISFRNTGDKTIRRVVIRDTLPPELDIATVLPGAGSHPYTFEVYEQGVLKITFENIELLPGGDGPASAGFVNFKVSQRPGNPAGTMIRNRALLFLDYQPPVQTNVVSHEVGNFPEFLTVSVRDNKTFVPGVKINIAPNPFIESTVFSVEGTSYKELIFSLYNMQGKLVRREVHRSNAFEIYRDNLTAGMYFYTVSSKEQIINTGKILVQ